LALKVPIILFFKVYSNFVIYIHIKIAPELNFRGYFNVYVNYEVRIDLKEEDNWNF